MQYRVAVKFGTLSKKKLTKRQQRLDRDRHTKKDTMILTTTRKKEGTSEKRRDESKKVVSNDSSIHLQPTLIYSSILDGNLSFLQLP